MPPAGTPRRSVAALLLAGLLAGPGTTACTGSGTDPAPVRAGAGPSTGVTGTGPDQAPAPLPSATTPRSAPGGGPLGLKWSRFQPDTFDYVGRHPGGWTFAEVEWCSVEPTPGQREWAELDAVVEEALALGHRPMLKLRTGQCWATLPPVEGTADRYEATRKTPSTPPSDLAAYLDHVDAVVRRYAARGVHDWAVENEVDVLNFWAADAAAYEELARAVAPVVRAADPEAHLLDSGVSSTGYGVVVAAEALAAGDEDGALATYRTHYGRRQAGGVSRWPEVADVADLATVLSSPAAQRSIDALDVAGRLVSEDVVDAWQLHFYEPEPALEGVLGLVAARAGEDAVVEAWEVGTAWPGSSYDEQVRADELFRTTARLLAHGVGRVVHLPVAWTPDAESQVFRGLVDPDGRLLPAGRGWMALADALAGARQAQAVDGGGLEGVSWRGDAGPAAIVWAAGEPVDLTTLQVDRLLGSDGEAPPDRSQVGTSPVLLLGSGADELADLGLR